MREGSTMKQTQLALLISDGIICKGVESIIKQSNFSSYGISEFGDTQSFLQSSIQFDLVLLDVSLYKSIEIEHDLRLIQKRFAHVKIIVISSRLTIQHIRYIMQLGVKGFIYRDELTKSLLHSIDLVLRDVVTLSQQPLELLTTSDLLISNNSLKSREMTVLQYTAQGLSPKQIANKLDIDVRTIHRDKQKLREILDVPTNDLLVDAAREQGLLDDERFN